MKPSNRFITDTYHLRDDNYIDIVIDKEFNKLESYIYNTNYGLKMYMFGQEYNSFSQYEEFRILVEENAEDYLESYYTLLEE